MSQTLHAPRLFVEDDLQAGRALTLSTGQAHYLHHVMRLQVGGAIRLFNGRSGEWRSEVTEISKRSFEIKPVEQINPQKTEPDLWLCCAPIRKAHFDYMIEKATELGVAVIQPILTSRTQIREVNVDRARSTAIEAAEQSERMSIPQIRKPSHMEDFVSALVSGRALIVCAEWGDALPLRDAFEQNREKITKAAIFTGPEGGFSAEELAFLKSAPNSLFVRLGPRILRADTAAISALSCWQAIAGDWRDTVNSENR